MAKKRTPQEVLIIDVESTCYGPNEPVGLSEIIAIGICHYDARNRSFAGRSLAVCPAQSTVTPYCTALTGITPQEASRGIGLAAACDQLRDHERSATRLWASWGDYDRVQFERDCARNEEAVYPFGTRHLNVKTLFALLTGESKEVGMAAALDRAGLPLIGTHHRAEDDAWNIALLLDYLIHERMPRA